MISEVASKVESGPKDVIRVTGACDVNFALANQFLVLIFIVSSPGLDRGGHWPWSGGRVTCVLWFLLLRVAM